MSASSRRSSRTFAPNKRVVELCPLWLNHHHLRPGSGSSSVSNQQRSTTNHRRRGAHASTPGTRAERTNLPHAAEQSRSRRPPAPPFQADDRESIFKAWPGWIVHPPSACFDVPHRSRSCRRRTQPVGALATGKGAIRGMAAPALTAVWTALRGASRRNQESDQR